MTNGLYPGAEWRPVVNHTPGAMRRPIMGPVLHHTVGPLAAAEARFNDPASSASAHFGNPIDIGPPMRQWVSLDDVAWAQVAGNWTGWVSFENESLAIGDLFLPLYEPQVQRIVEAYAWMALWHGVPVRVTDDPSVAGIAYHSLNPPEWGITGCPGQPIIDQRPEIVRRTLDLIGGVPTPTPPKPGPPAHQEGLTTVQIPYGLNTLVYGVNDAGFLVQRSLRPDGTSIEGADVPILAGCKPNADVSASVTSDSRIFVSTLTTDGNLSAINYRPGDGWYDANGRKLQSLP